MAYNHNYHYYEQLFSFNEIETLKNDNAIVNATNGGLIIGPSHDEGGVYFLTKYNDGYRLMGEVEGFEFILNPISTKKYNKIISQINNYERDFHYGFYNDSYNSNFEVIDARSPNFIKYKSKFITIDYPSGFSIINKFSTKRFFYQLFDRKSGTF